MSDTDTQVLIFCNVWLIFKLQCVNVEVLFYSILELFQVLWMFLSVFDMNARYIHNALYVEILHHFVAPLQIY